MSTPPGAKMETTTGLTCTTPCTLEVPRRDTFTAKFTLGDQVEQIFVDTEIPDSVAATTAANVLFKPIILIPAAIAIDAVSGANLNHTPNPVVVTFRQIDAREEDVAGAGAPETAEENENTGPTGRTFKLDEPAETHASAAGAASTTGIQASPPIAVAQPEPEPDLEQAIWINVTVDATSGLHYHCSHFSGVENKLPLDGTLDWHAVRLAHDPGIQLYARVKTLAGQPAIEFWQRADNRTESDAFTVPMPSLAPGTSQSQLIPQRTVDPYDVCGHFTIFVDVVPAPGSA